MSAPTDGNERQNGEFHPNDGSLDGMSNNGNLGDVDTGFDNMMNQINHEEGEIMEDDPEVMKILEDVEKVEDFGPPIADHIAVAYTNTAMRPLSKETSDVLKKGIQIPDNCKALRVPKVNPEIWQHLRTKQRVSDIKLQQTQVGCSVALTTLALMSDEIAKSSKLIPKELLTKLLKCGMDGANLIGHQMQEISKRRRMEIKPYINPEYSGICNDKVTGSEFLFGDNFAETLRTTKTTSSVIRNLGLQRNRYHPFQAPPQRGSLNYQRPSTSFRGKWNGQPQQQQQGRSYSSRFLQNNRFQHRTPFQSPNQRTFQGRNQRQ